MYSFYQHTWTEKRPAADSRIVMIEKIYGVTKPRQGGIISLKSVMGMAKGCVGWGREEEGGTSCRGDGDRVKREVLQFLGEVCDELSAAHSASVNYVCVYEII